LPQPQGHRFERHRNMLVFQRNVKVRDVHLSGYRSPTFQS
jgi:hypothetical protein